jgi:hypothetical protein
MGELFRDVGNTVDTGFAREGVESAQSAYQNAIEAAKTEIPVRNTLRKKLGVKLPGEMNPTIDAQKIRSAFTSSGELVREKLMKAAQTAGADANLTKITDLSKQIEANIALQSDLNVLKNPASPLAKAVGKLPMVGGLIPNSKANLIQGYNSVSGVVSSTFASPTLTAAIKLLERTGKPLTMGLIQSLARQHGVNPDELQSAVSQVQEVKP